MASKTLSQIFNGVVRRVLSRVAVLTVAGICSLGPVFAGAFEDFFDAVKTDQVEAVRALLARGVDPNMREEHRHETGLMLALRKNSTSVFEVLLAAPDIQVNAEARNGDTALMIAAYMGNAHAVRKLLAKGASVNRPGWTALHYAAAAGANDVIKILLQQSAYIDAESPDKTTPLMMAAQGGHAGTVKLLLDEGADVMLKNELGLNALDFAVQAGHKDIVEELAILIGRSQ